MDVFGLLLKASAFVVRLESISAVRTFQASTSPSAILKTIYQFLISGNPFILIVLGIILFFAGKLAKVVGIVIIILGLIHLALPYLLKTI